MDISFGIVPEQHIGGSGTHISLWEHKHKIHFHKETIHFTVSGNYSAFGVIHYCLHERRQIIYELQVSNSSLTENVADTFVKFAIPPPIIKIFPKEDNIKGF